MRRNEETDDRKKNRRTHNTYTDANNDNKKCDSGRIYKEIIYKGTQTATYPRVPAKAVSHTLKRHYLELIQESVRGGDGGDGLKGGQIVLLLDMKVLKGAANRPKGGGKMTGRKRRKIVNQTRK